jgi:mRNA-degrading endonuclease RelE of RelBE toxin-antitoxin system
VTRRPPHKIEITHDAVSHLAGLAAGARKSVLDTLEQQLAFEPTKETRNRKRLRPNPVAPWEPRIGDLRVYFEVDDGPFLLVRVLAVGIKKRNHVFIGGERVELT